MRVEAIRWVGTQTEDAHSFEQTVSLFRDVLGLTVVFEEPHTVELALQSDDRIQIYGPGGPLGRTPVPLLEVDDVREARRTLRGHGIAVGELEQDSAWEWFRIRAPDGCDYELAQRKPA